MTTEKSNGSRQSTDVISTAKTFSELLLPSFLLKGLKAAGFHTPSPLQQAALPLARAGLDVFVQAEAGTGKAAVIGVACLERVKPSNLMPQALIVASTRETALQTAEIIKALASRSPKPAAEIAVFIGGVPIEQDQKVVRRVCHIIVATPGRVCALIEKGDLVTSGIHLLVLDDADTLMSDTFRTDVFWLHCVLPKAKQVLGFSATCIQEVQRQIEGLMRKPQRVLLASRSASRSGVRQFYKVVAEAGGGAEGVSATKLQTMMTFLCTVEFYQVVIFCNQECDGQAVVEHLKANGFSAAFFPDDMAPADRGALMKAADSFSIRALVTTDSEVCGLNREKMNAVVNFDLPLDSVIYKQRIDRGQCLNPHGLAATFVSELELPMLRDFIQAVNEGEVEPLPAVLFESDYMQPDTQARYRIESSAAIPPVALPQQAVENSAPPDVSMSDIAADAEGEENGLPRSIEGGNALPAFASNEATKSGAALEQVNSARRFSESEEVEDLKENGEPARDAPAVLMSGGEERGSGDRPDDSLRDQNGDSSQDALDGSEIAATESAAEENCAFPTAQAAGNEQSTAADLTTQITSTETENVDLAAAAPSAEATQEEAGQAPKPTPVADNGLEQLRELLESLPQAPAQVRQKAVREPSVLLDTDAGAREMTDYEIEEAILQKHARINAAAALQEDDREDESTAMDVPLEDASEAERSDSLESGEIAEPAAPLAELDADSADVDPYQLLSPAEQLALWESYYYETHGQQAAPEPDIVSDEDGHLREWTAWFAAYTAASAGPAETIKPAPKPDSPAKRVADQTANDIPTQRAKKGAATSPTPTAPLPRHLREGEPLQQGSWDKIPEGPDPEGFVRVPASWMARYHELEWQFWQSVANRPL